MKVETVGLGDRTRQVAERTVIRIPPDELRAMLEGACPGVEFPDFYCVNALESFELDCGEFGDSPGLEISWVKLT